MQTTIRNLLIMAFFSLAGCQGTNLDSASGIADIFGSLTKGDVRRNIIFLLDVSKSTSSQQKDAYIKAIELTYRTLTVRDRLVISTIDGGSYINPVRVLSEDLWQAKAESDLMFGSHFASLPPNERKKLSPPFFRPEDAFKAKAKRQEHDRLDAYKTMSIPKLRPLILDTYKQRAKYGGSSNILWALKNIQSDLESNNDEVTQKDELTIHNYIVLLSDMVHENDEISFDKALGILRPESEDLLLKLSNINRIPALNGAHIICLGRAKTAVIRSEAGVQNIEEFWNAFFSKKYANGIMIAYAAIDKVERLDNWLNVWKEL